MMLASMRNGFIFFVLFFYSCAATVHLPEIIPHRGGKAERPENTIQAFQECIDLGATTLELDVQVTKDGVAVVYHPGNLSVNTDGKGKIDEYTYQELQNFDAAYNFEKEGSYLYRGKGYKIPTLEEVMIKFPKTLLIIDLKSLPADTLINAVARVINKINAWDRILFYSTDDNHLSYLKKAYPQALSFESRKATVEELLNSTGSAKLIKSDKATWLGFELVRQLKISEKLALGDAEYPINLVVWTEPGVTRIREKLPHAKFVLFGINTTEDYLKAASLGAFAVYSDNPELLFNFAKSNDNKKK
jgi:glycerophosphoryl diester phosphodiesterase